MVPFKELKRSEKAEIVGQDEFNGSEYSTL